MKITFYRLITVDTKIRFDTAEDELSDVGCDDFVPTEVPSALRLLDAKEKKDGDLHALENGVDSDTETGGETPSNSHDPSTKERTSSRGSKESRGSRSSHKKIREPFSWMESVTVYISTIRMVP